MKRIFAVIIVVLLFGFAKPASAQEKSTFEKIFLFGAGYLSGHAAHESGHILSAKLFNINRTMHWDWKEVPPLYGVIHESWRYDRRKLATTAASGFYMEIISSEIILNYGSIREENGDYNYFLLGWVTMTILNPIMYAIRDRMTSGGWGDLKNIELDSHNRNTMEVLIVTHAVLNLIRIIAPAIDKQDIFSISSTPNAISVQIALR